MCQLNAVILGVLDTFQQSARFPPFTSKLIFYSYFLFESPHLAISLIFIAFFEELKSLELMVNTDILNSITPFIFQLVPLLFIINKSKESCSCLVCGSFYTVHVVHMINIFYSVWLEACKHLYLYFYHIILSLLT